ncbi:hypothetical protein [Acidibrevibacterium fodinaquatile]|uniref:hypothetical protein n=1 Tax=Acidibrevibacterium fodinaquatile TaxID=1969806 RepID=UPI001F079869|nr:hypothetical protein [Acidibrevibacterium fodinaquatile]
MSTARAPGTPPDGESPAGGAGNETPDLAALAQDWITLWQSEISALVADREMQEAWQALAGLWAGVLASAIQAMPREPGPREPGPRQHEPFHNGVAGAAPPPRAAAAAAPSDPRDAEIERLHRRLAALERRLARLEPAPKPRSRPPRARKRRS